MIAPAKWRRCVADHVLQAVETAMHRMHRAISKHRMHRADRAACLHGERWTVDVLLEAASPSHGKRVGKRVGHQRRRWY
eukprot:SAG31_NODE_2068_length_6521_cov_6.298194_10_plen_79_part_00